MEAKPGRSGVLCIGLTVEERRVLRQVLNEAFNGIGSANLPIDPLLEIRSAERLRRLLEMDSPRTAEMTNDPAREFGLYVELLNDGQYKARLQRNPIGELEIIFYGGDRCPIPWGWLAGIASRFGEETPPR